MINKATELKRIERDIKMERLVRRNMNNRGEELAAVDERIKALSRRASALRKHLEPAR